MIKTRHDLFNYIQADRKAQGMRHPLLAKLTFGENAMIRKYMTILRKAEYWKVHSEKIVGKLMFAYYFLRYRRMCLRYGIHIGLNAVGKGFFIVHPGFIRIDSWVHIGENCTVLPMVLFGRAHPIGNTEIFVGDNCYVGTGSTILGPIKIGNNVTIAAGAVVTKDVPDNVVVAGVPARIVKYKNNVE